MSNSKLIVSYIFTIISDNEKHVINALQDGNMTTILCENYDAELKIQNAEVIDEIHESM